MTTPVSSQQCGHQGPRPAPGGGPQRGPHFPRPGSAPGLRRPAAPAGPSRQLPASTAPTGTPRRTAAGPLPAPAGPPRAPPGAASAPPGGASAVAHRLTAADATTLTLKDAEQPVAHSPGAAFECTGWRTERRRQPGARKRGSRARESRRRVTQVTLRIRARRAADHGAWRLAAGLDRVAYPAETSGDEGHPFAGGR